MKPGPMAEAVTAYLGLGGNVGDVARSMRDALRKLEQRHVARAVDVTRRELAGRAHVEHGRGRVVGQGAFEFGDVGDAVGRLGVGGHGAPQRSRLFFSKMIRSPCRVSQGSWCWIISDRGAIRPESPPLATTVAAVSSSASNRRTMPSTTAVYP